MKRAREEGEEREELSVKRPSKTLEALRESEHRFRALFESMTEGVALHELVLDADGSPVDYVVTDVNPAYGRHTPIPPEAAVGKRASSLYGTGEAPYLERFARVARTGEPDRLEIYFEPMDRHFRILVFSPGPGRFATVFEDITEGKRLQAALTASNAALTARNEELDAYAHTVAHDLKNPVSVLLGFAEHLEQGGPQLPEEERRECVAGIARCAEKMRDITDGLLLLAEARRGEVTNVPLDMDAIVSESLRALDHVLRERRAEVVRPREWPSASGYAPWVEQIWTNYVSNAVKYGGDPPRVTLGADPGPGDSVRFWVRDNGRGITERDRARLFTPFTRLPHTQRAGHGLGLSIVRRLVEKMGGAVSVEASGAPEPGSTFSFTLPVAAP